MQDVVQVARYVDEFRDVVVVVFELLEGEQMGNIVQVAGQEVVHTDDLISFADKAVAQVRAQKAGRAGDQNSFHRERPLMVCSIMYSCTSPPSSECMGRERTLWARDSDTGKSPSLYP